METGSESCKCYVSFTTIGNIQIILPEHLQSAVTARQVGSREKCFS